MEVFAYLFYFLLFCVGIRFIYKSYPQFKENWEARKWDKVKGEIIEIKVNQKWQSLDESIENNNQFQLGYEFDYKGERYQNSQLDLESKLVHSFKSNKEQGLHMYNLNLFLEDVRNHPTITVWVNPNNPSMSIIRNLWTRYLFNVCFGAAFMIWGVCTTILFMKTESNVGNIKIEDKIEVVEYLPDEVIKELEYSETAKAAGERQKRLEENRKWREENGIK